MPEIQPVRKQWQAGRQRDAQQRQRQPQRTAAGCAALAHAGKQQPPQTVQRRKRQRKAQKPRHAVDRLLGQRDAVQVQLAFAVLQGGGQIVQPRPGADPQPRRGAAVAVVQRQRVGRDGGRYFFGGKRQAARAVLHVKGRRVGRLAGKILHRHLIRAGSQRRRGRGKRHFLLAGIRAVVVYLQRAAVRVHGGNVSKLVGKLGGRQRQLVRRAKQPGGQVQQHGGLGSQHGGKQFVAPQKCGDTLPCFHVTGPLSRPRS